MAPTVADYTEGEAFQSEKRTVFAREWLPLCHAGQVPGAGHFAAQSVGGWPLFAVRGRDGAVRAFRNVCRHQNMQVVEKAAGQCDELRCRYHGWTYDLAGRFVTAPEPVAPPDRLAASNNLPPLPTVDVRGFVLCALDPSGPPDSSEVDALLAQGSGGASPVAPVTATGRPPMRPRAPTCSSPCSRTGPSSKRCCSAPMASPQGCPKASTWHL